MENYFQVQANSSKIIKTFNKKILAICGIFVLTCGLHCFQAAAQTKIEGDSTALPQQLTRAPVSWNIVHENILSLYKTSGFEQVGQDGISNLASFLKKYTYTTYLLDKESVLITLAPLAKWRTENYSVEENAEFLNRFAHLTKLPILDQKVLLEEFQSNIHAAGKEDAETKQFAAALKNEQVDADKALRLLQQLRGRVIYGELASEHIQIAGKKTANLRLKRIGDIIKQGVAGLAGSGSLGMSGTPGVVPSEPSQLHPDDPSKETIKKTGAFCAAQGADGKSTHRLQPPSEHKPPENTRRKQIEYLSHTLTALHDGNGGSIDGMVLLLHILPIGQVREQEEIAAQRMIEIARQKMETSKPASSAGTTKSSFYKSKLQGIMKPLGVTAVLCLFVIIAASTLQFGDWLGPLIGTAIFSFLIGGPANSVRLIGKEQLKSAFVGACIGAFLGFMLLNPLLKLIGINSHLLWH